MRLSALLLLLITCSCAHSNRCFDYYSALVEQTRKEFETAHQEFDRASADWEIAYTHKDKPAMKAAHTRDTFWFAEELRLHQLANKYEKLQQDSLTDKNNCILNGDQR